MAGVYGPGCGERSDGPDLCASEGGTVRWFRYVLHSDRAAYEEKGWRFAANLGPSHGSYSVLMEYYGGEGTESAERAPTD